MYRIRQIQLVFIFVFLFGAVSVSAQVADDWGFPEARNRRNKDDDKVLNDMLAKQRLAKEKKDHEEMVSRAEKALALSEALGKSIENSDHLVPADQKKLAELEKLALKIRSDLGGSDDDDESEVTSTRDSSLSLRESFSILRESTIKMANEIKKTTRYSISVVAIESSNAVIRLTRFLRLRS